MQVLFGLRKLGVEHPAPDKPRAYMMSVHMVASGSIPDEIKAYIDPLLEPFNSLRQDP